MGTSLRAGLLRIAALAALVVAGDRALAALFDLGLPHSEFRFSLALRGGQPANLLVLGDSRAVNGLYTPELERLTRVPVLNLAYNGMSTLIAEAVLRDYLARNAAPRLLALEVTNVQDLQPLLDGLMCYWHLAPALAALAQERSPANLRAIRVLHTYAYNGEIPLRALYYARRSDQDWINRYRISPALVAEARAEPDFELHALPENLAALGRIAALARERHIPLRLLVTPYLPEYVAHVRNWDEWLEQLRSAAGPDERIWDYGRAIRDDAQFADRLHLNELGGIPFAQRLAADGFLAFDGSSAPQ
jgi:lysophospholipase L1-like esterase